MINELHGFSINNPKKNANENNINLYLIQNG